MPSIYQKKELKQPGFFQRLLGKQPEENAFTEINNLLASKPVSEISIREVVDIAEKYRTDIYKKFGPRLKELYSIYLRHCITDHSFSPDEREELLHMKALLNLTDQDVGALLDEIAGAVYRKKTDDIISDGRLEEDEIRILEQMKSELMLPDNIANKISAESRDLFVKKYLDNAISDLSLSDDEWTELQAISKSLRATVEYDDATKRLLDRLRLYWVIENGTLPVHKTELHLHRNEICYFTAPATWLENRTVTRSIRYGGPAVSIRIVKGLYYRAGQMDLQRITEEHTVEVDSGTLYITGKRIIFTGSRRNTNIRLDRILSVNPFSDGVEIVKDAGKNPVFRLTRDIDIFAMILSRVISDYNK